MQYKNAVLHYVCIIIVYWFCVANANISFHALYKITYVNYRNTKSKWLAITIKGFYHNCGVLQLFCQGINVIIFTILKCSTYSLLTWLWKQFGLEACFFLPIILLLHSFTETFYLFQTVIHFLYLSTKMCLRWWISMLP